MKIQIGAVSVMLSWASCYPLIFLTLDYAPVMLTAFYRSVIAGLFLVFIALLLKRPLPNNRRQWLFIIAIGISATSIGFWGMFYSASLISPGLATVLTNTQPLIAGILGWFILKEHMNKSVALAMAIGFAGIAMIGSESLWSNNGQSVYGVIYILIAASGIAVSNILLKLIASKVDIYYATGFQLLIGAIPLGIFSFYQAHVTNTSVVDPIVESIVYPSVVTLLAIPGTALPFLIWFWLMDKAPLYHLNMYSFLTPVFGLYLGWFYFDESLTFWQWTGIVIIALAVGYISLNSTTKRALN
ncbi:DMT family transporter [Glaciecola sp. SC05]|uniref:DMT family transporter n=1 Tax=Glaciecola sp. SC05 TaxID=1987355 RepID=UPI003529342D